MEDITLTNRIVDIIVNMTPSERDSFNKGFAALEDAGASFADLLPLCPLPDTKTSIEQDVEELYGIITDMNDELRELRQIVKFNERVMTSRTDGIASYIDGMNGVQIEV